MRSLALALALALPTLAAAQSSPSSAAPQPAPARAAADTTTRRGPVLDGEVSDMYVKGDSLEVVFTNTGTLRAEIVGKVEIHTAHDSVVARVELAEASVAPGVTHRMRIAMPRVARGAYTMWAVVDFGGEQLTAAQAALTIK